MRARTLCLSILVLACLHGAAWAQTWPTRPIRVLIPFGAGSATDVVPRVVFEQLTQQLGQPIVVENRTGAGGTLATGAVAKADPDGYTLLATSNAHTIAPALYGNLAYDVAQDFAAVTPFVSLPRRADHRALKGHQDRPGAGDRRQGQARRVQLRLGRHRSGTTSAWRNFA